MPTFAYVVKDSKGNKHEGTISADSLDAALNKLRDSGQTVISVVDSKKAGGGNRYCGID